MLHRLTWRPGALAMSDGAAKANLTARSNGNGQGRVVTFPGSTPWRPCHRRDFLSCCMINAPAQQLVTVMNAVGRNLAVVVDQGVKENKFSA